MRYARELNTSWMCHRTGTRSSAYKNDVLSCGGVRDHLVLRYFRNLWDQVLPVGTFFEGTACILQRFRVQTLCLVKCRSSLSRLVLSPSMPEFRGFDMRGLLEVIEDQNRLPTLGRPSKPRKCLCFRRGLCGAADIRSRTSAEHFPPRAANIYPLPFPGSLVLQRAAMPSRRSSLMCWSSPR